MSDWISVKDRLPEYGRSVMLCSVTGGVAEGMRDRYLGFVQYRWSATGVKPTHWMPLPEPPEDAE